MGGRSTLRIVLLGVVYSMLSSPPIHAQLPPRVEKCLPDPTLAREIGDMLEETAAPQVKDPKLAERITEMLEETTPRITIDKITFQGKTHLPKSATAQVAAGFEGVVFEPDSDWRAFFREIAADAWQQRGYYYAKVSVQPQVSGGDAIDQRVSLTVHVDERPRFRLARIRFIDTHVFPPTELRKAFPMRDGDVFDIAKVRRGFEALLRLYHTRGYINFVATPDLQVDMAHRRISLVVDVEEGEQFRVGSVTVLNLDQPALEGLLKARLRPGDVFNPELVKEFLSENKSVLPADASLEDEEVKQNEKNATVDLVFDFWDCPKDP